nr:MAG TPA: hypothetical protein [Caudoviricetes sp.]
MPDIALPPAFDCIKLTFFHKGCAGGRECARRQVRHPARLIKNSADRHTPTRPNHMRTT